MKARILAYHRLSDRPSAGVEQWAVRPAAFRRQMALLKRLGYRGVSVQTLLTAIESCKAPEKLVGISFDDGYRDTVTIAAPVLREFGFAATVYVVPDAVGGEATWEQGGTTAPLASWEELSGLVEAGWEIGMHSRSHLARFDLLRGEELDDEARSGVAAIQERLATPVVTFAYPHGHYSDASLAALDRAGYRWAVTTVPGEVSADSEPLELPRYEIKRRDTLLEFAMLMLAGVLLRRRRTFARLVPGRRRPSSESTARVGT
ncbi:MAG: polysaccharide deacetylase family protein [Thermomicrobiales bacterium]